MGPKKGKTRKRPNKDTGDAKTKYLSKAKLKLYITLTLATVFVTSFSALLFLVPFVIDPSLAAMRADFVAAPVDCRGVQSKYILGK